MDRHSAGGAKARPVVAARAISRIAIAARAGTRISGDTSGILPGFEFNYGLIPNGQLHIVAVTAFDRPAGNPIHSILRSGARYAANV